MSEYSYEPRSRGHRTREREREPEYVTETTYIERGARAAPVRDLVYRPREESIEDIPRDFPPGTEYRQTKYREEYAPPRRARSVNRYDEEDDYYYGRNDRGRRPPARSEYGDDYPDRHDRPKPSRRKSIVENITKFGEAAGLGGVIGAVTGKGGSRSRSRPSRRDHDRYGDRRYDSRSRSRSGSRVIRKSEKSEKWEQAAKAALVAGAVEAFRSRNEAGPWTGAKGQRIATAAIAAGGLKGLVDKDPTKHEKRDIAGSALGGLLINRATNGERSRSRAPRGRDDSRSPSRTRSRSRSVFGRSRSRSIFGRSRSRGRSASRDRESDGGRGGLAKVAGTGAVIAAGKALYDRVRSKSRSRRDRSRSSSADSYVPSRRDRRSYSRGRSMDTYSEAPSRANPDRRLAAAGVGAGAGAMTAPRGRSRRDSSAGSESSTDIEEQRKKLRGKELLTAGLATVATIHAAHGVYTSMEASEKRRELVGEGEMSPEEARKRKSKNMLQDAAAVGIAALGIKSAYSEWKEMNEQRHSVKELEARRRKRRKQRERQEKDARYNTLGKQNGYANPYAYPVAATPSYAPTTTYADANPYGASMPPPPMGARY